jgi:hypothetical protein
VNSSERLRPNAFTRINTSSIFGVGTGMLSIFKTSGPPASWITAAFIVCIVVIVVLFSDLCIQDTSRRST